MEMLNNYQISEKPCNIVQIGPLMESTRLSSGLDYYKPTMSQLAYEKERNTEVRFSFHNRGEQRLADYIDQDALQQRFDNIRENGWAAEELQYLASLKSNNGDRVFTNEYIEYIRTNEMPAFEVNYDEEIDDISIEPQGPWALVSFWETIILSEVNEAYFEGYMQANNIDLFEIYDEGNRRLSEKIAVLKENPDIKFADFGTRRHFSLRWQKHVVERLLDECPENIVGTSNVGLADSLGTKPIGTFAHEMPMVYAGLAELRGENVRASHNKFLQDWDDRYPEDLLIALTDTFTTEFFFSDFTKEQAETWRGVRQDSGDPYEFGERLIKFYEDFGIDPAQKTVVFSDSLDIDTIVSLHKAFKDKINVLFGWGTSLTNDLGFKALNIVAKATYVEVPEAEEGVYTVKLSDDAGKHTGPPEQVKTYQENDNYFAIAA